MKLPRMPAAVVFDMDGLLLNRSFGRGEIPVAHAACCKLTATLKSGIGGRYAGAIERRCGCAPHPWMYGQVMVE